MKPNLPLRLAVRARRFRHLKATGKPGRPEALSIEITRRCIARCVMCNIWQTPADLPELTADEWLEVLGSPLLSGLKELDITGGEPFLRDDLAQLLLGVGKLKAERLPHLCSIAITTNGFLTQNVLDVVSTVIGTLDLAGISLVFACGMDAVGDVHDSIRGVPGGWTRLHATIKGLKKFRERHPSLVIGIKTTVTRYNIDELEHVCQYADMQGLFTIISPYILTSNRYANIDQEEMLALSSVDREKLKIFYDSPRFRWSYYRTELLRFLETGRMEKPCSAGFNYFFIRSTGEVFCCPIINAPLGNVTQTPLAELLRSPEAVRFRRGVCEFSECATCTEPGLERYALPFEGSHYLRLYFSMSLQDFSTLHGHLGLEKYFP
ncbi:MAG: radical SAM protein [Deltaproteobacteria bacterium]|nr:radical SAM protein [Deltaproteobacteria bacterium]